MWKLLFQVRAIQEHPVIQSKLKLFILSLDVVIFMFEIIIVI